MGRKALLRILVLLNGALLICIVALVVDPSWIGNRIAYGTAEHVPWERALPSSLQDSLVNEGAHEAVLLFQSTYDAEAIHAAVNTLNECAGEETALPVVVVSPPVQEPPAGTPHHFVPDAERRLAQAFRICSEGTVIYDVARQQVVRSYGTILNDHDLCLQQQWAAMR